METLLDISSMMCADLHRRFMRRNIPHAALLFFSLFSHSHLTVLLSLSIFPIHALFTAVKYVCMCESWLGMRFEISIYVFRIGNEKCFRIHASFSMDSTMRYITSFPICRSALMSATRSSQSYGYNHTLCCICMNPAVRIS